MAGWASLTVARTADGSAIEWEEEARFAGIGRVLDLPNKLVGPRLFGRLVDGSHSLLTRGSRYP
mgnify:CR=1 FL=1